MQELTEILQSIFVPIWGAVVTFFAYRILGIATKINELHQIFIPNLHEELNSFIIYNREQIAMFHDRLNTLEKSIENIKFEIVKVCRSEHPQN